MTILSENKNGVDKETKKYITVLFTKGVFQFFCMSCFFDQLFALIKKSKFYFAKAVFRQGCNSPLCNVLLNVLFYLLFTLCCIILFDFINENLSLQRH